ncbi:hypothetical protein ZHAS_00012276 [Anopheles sinensis]|uniref:Uncharacterized protein n=1 Tax=Anopheles sinensis TaxID=74873 RepID=A0A084W294_ANOSI|nr:hypothetical protein ZHAS_00012276 [Anopheles sinensis]
MAPGTCGFGEWRGGGGRVRVAAREKQDGQWKKPGTHFATTIISMKYRLANSSANRTATVRPVGVAWRAFSCRANERPILFGIWKGYVHPLSPMVGGCGGSGAATLGKRGQRAHVDMISIFKCHNSYTNGQTAHDTHLSLVRKGKKDPCRAGEIALAATNPPTFAARLTSGRCYGVH